MEDALISPEGFMILSGAGLIDAKADKPIYQHITETIDVNDGNRYRADLGNGVFAVYVENKPYLPADKGENYAYVMCVNNGEIITEPYIPVHEKEENGRFVLSGLASAIDEEAYPAEVKDDYGKTYYRVLVVDHDMYVAASDYSEDPEHRGEYNTQQDHKYSDTSTGALKNEDSHGYDVKDIPAQLLFNAVLVDYYTARQAGAKQMEITADKFGGNYYLEASTLFRDTNGSDLPAEFIIPNCKIQSNFTFTMASSGDPSTFTFTIDAFPDYTKFDHSKKVLAAIQVIEYLGDQDLHRHSTSHETYHNSLNW